MSLAVVYSRARRGLDAPLVRVETHLSNGLPALNIVGLPEAAVKESKDRVRSAIINSHLEFPARRITINLSPADLPKEGGRFDLPIALGILAASEQLPANSLNNAEFIGELALGGELRPVTGSLGAALQCKQAGRHLFVAADNAEEAALAAEGQVYGAKSLLELLAHLRQQVVIAPQTKPVVAATEGHHYPDMADVKGQQQARRCLEIAAAGEHNLLFSGPPGTGKTMLASRLPGILPPLTEQECLEVASIYSLFPATSHQLAFGSRPFRSPHHSASSVALVGGGSHPRPGEITLAHRGVLFLDELPEYQRQVLEVLREPLESGGIEISRANQQVHFPARFQLIAAMNPCPCGYFGDAEQPCRCSPDRVRRYQDKISGPLLDRIDLNVTLARIPHSELFGKALPAESSAAIRQRVVAARQLQWQRQGCSNSQLDAKAVEQHCALQPALANWLATAAERLKLSPRAYFRLIKVARSIADLSQSTRIEAPHLHEAISYRGHS